MISKANQLNLNQQQTTTPSLLTMLNQNQKQTELPKLNEVKALPNVKTLEEIENELLNQSSKSSSTNNNSTASQRPSQAPKLPQKNNISASNSSNNLQSLQSLKFSPKGNLSLIQPFTLIYAWNILKRAPKFIIFHQK